MLHFETTIISRNKEGHAILKRVFESSTDNLKTMIDVVILLLMNEYQNYLIKINETKIKLFMKFRKSIFQFIIAHVTLTALKKIMSQYEKLINQSTIILSCIETFIISIELSCNHKIQKYLFVKNDLLLNDVHFHWK